MNLKKDILFSLLLIVFLSILTGCFQRNVEGEINVFDFLTAEKATLTLPQYKSWLEDSLNQLSASISTDTFQVTITYRPAVFEAGMSYLNDQGDYKSLFEEKDKYHLFVVECLDKRPATAMKLKGGYDCITKLSKGIFVVQNNRDTIFPIIEVFPSMMLNKPSHIYILVPKEVTHSSYTAYLNAPMLGSKEVLSLKIDSTILSDLPKLNL